MNNWIPIQPVLTQNDGSQTVNFATPSTQTFDNSYNSDTRWIQPIQRQQTTRPYEPTSFEPTYGNENNVSKLDPDDITSSNPSYGLETSVLNFNQTLNSKPQNHIQNWSFEDSNLLIPLPESLLHNVDMEKLQNMNQPVLDDIHHGTIHSTIPKNHSMTTAQMQVHSEATLQDKTINESQANHDLIRAGVIRTINEVELKGGPKIFTPQNHGRSKAN